MSKHTPRPLHNITGHKPGPWIRQVLNDESEAYIHDKHCNAIARVYSLSDASLIAAAPELLAALNAASEWLNDMGCEHEEPDLRCVVCLVNAAINKAEGRDK